MTDAHGVARDQLRAFIERIERLEEEKKTIADDIKDVYGEAKAMGYDTKIMKQVIALRKKDERERTEEEIILDTYMQALGMIPDFEHETPSATRRAKGSGTGSAAQLQIRSETISEAPKQVYGDSVDRATAPPSQSVNIPAGGDQGHEIDGSDDRCPAELHSPETANETVGGFPVAAAPTNAEEQALGSTGENKADENVVVKSVTVVGTESGTVAISPETAPEKGASVETDGVTSPSIDSGFAPSILDGEETSIDANTGGDDVTGSALRAGHQDRASNNGESTRSAFPGKAYNLRPNCLKTTNCAGHGSRHCHACTVAARESEEA